MAGAYLVYIQEIDPRTARVTVSKEPVAGVRSLCYEDAVATAKIMYQFNCRQAPHLVRVSANLVMKVWRCAKKQNVDFLTAYRICLGRARNSTTHQKLSVDKP